MRLGHLLILLVVTAPLAQAAYVHDENYTVAGRVLDQGGLPAGHVTLRVELVGTDDFVSAEAPKTSCNGDFFVFFPVGDLEDVRVRVTLGGQTVEQDADETYRRSFIKLQADNVTRSPSCREARDTFGQSHVVTGRLLNPSGEPADQEPVRVELALSNGSTLQANGTTNQAGDYAVYFQSSRLPANGTATVRALGQERSVPMDDTFHLSVSNQQEAAEASVPVLWALLALTAAALARRLR